MSSLLEESHPASPPCSLKTNSPQSPISSYQLRQSICGLETELMIQTFDDRILVIITQNGKIGCLTQASLPIHTPLPPPPKPSTMNGHENPLHILEILPSPPSSLSLTPLLGSPPDQTLNDLYVSQIATLVFWALETSGSGRRNVVVGMTLKQPSSRHQSRRSDGDGGSQDDDDDNGILDQDERMRYAGVMDLVSQWPGPSPDSTEQIE
ncbi:uncharacterized protein IL334_007186 [Kwoniella shivajii]|uniref:Proteasome assembly chaperone 3 n=1 Tax=Kwoniella shivajii TaxID=564305 RepID=A0ABZ1D803_9TREE|nr:hypothetical protein IL334_007186 [Kwoniella shivajii]